MPSSNTATPPLDGTGGYAPSQLLNSRLLRSKLPSPLSLLLPHHVPPMGPQLAIRQEKQAAYFNVKASVEPLPRLEQQQQVWFHAKPTEWQRGRIARENLSPRSYVISTPSGTEFRRNRKDIRPAHEAAEPCPGNTQQTSANTLPQGGTPHPEGASLPNSSELSQAAPQGSVVGESAQSEPSHTRTQHKYDTERVGKTTCTRSGRLSKPPTRLVM